MFNLRAAILATIGLASVPAGAQSPTVSSNAVTAEQFIAQHVFQTFFFTRSNNPQLYAQGIIREFQDGFRAYKPNLPYVNVGSLSDECKVILVAYIGEEDFVRKWDGSIEPGLVTATAVVIDLRYLDPKTTRIYPRDDMLQVDIELKKSTGSNTNVIYMYKYAGSEIWRIGAFPLGRPNPFHNVLGGVGGKLFFHITEDERAEAVDMLKTIFAKCR